MGIFLEMSLYKNAYKIITVSKGIKKTIEERGGKGKTDIVYNGTYEKILNYNNDGYVNMLSDQWQNKKVVLYAGLLGLGQSLQLLLPEMAACNKEDFLFVFIGDGPLKKELLEKSKEYGICARFF